MRLFKAVWRVSVEEFFIYRATSFFTFFLAAIFFVVELLAGHIFFAASGSVNGWDGQSYQLLIATVSSVVYLYNIFFIVGHENLSEDILEGNLDYTLIRPVSSYWFTSMAQIDVPSIFNFVISLVVVGVSLKQLSFTAVGVVLYVFAALLAFGLFFILNKAVVTVTFWVDGFTALGGIMEDSIDLLSRPAGIFPRILRFIFMFIVPVLLVTNLPVLSLKLTVSSYWHFAYIVLFEVVLYLLSRWLWNKGIRRYFSAN
ncbi:ABC-2 family transporter protein [Lacticaseibacillus zhaodongensis]|uniref:ABC-2 family transporter protein n=1 Tax=Lacticaseibacillus zhaodongensis TaxID=2668065 RepID=UPI0012D2CB83|nr:ABC-2 family transporter protein [Lacticaseibacillus zhaodongensis]